LLELWGDASSSRFRFLIGPWPHLRAVTLVSLHFAFDRQRYTSIHSLTASPCSLMSRPEGIQSRGSSFYSQHLEALFKTCLLCRIIYSLQRVFSSSWHQCFRLFTRPRLTGPIKIMFAQSLAVVRCNSQPTSASLCCTTSVSSHILICGQRI